MGKVNCKTKFSRTGISLRRLYTRILSSNYPAMNDAANSETLSGLADIELPAPPDWQPLLIAGGVIIIFLMLIVLIRLTIRHRKKSSVDIGAHLDPALAARLQLQQLIHDWQSHTINDREAAYRLVTLLRLGLGLPQLTDTCPPHIAADQQAWQETVALCTHLRYQQAPTTLLSLETFQRAEQWLLKTREHGV